MNTFASGSSREAKALVLALALPGMLTTWMLNQPAMLGQATADKNPIAAISDVGQTVVNEGIALNAAASYDLSGSTLNYAWNFGDGSTASGVAVGHTYKTVGAYTLTLTVGSATGARRISKAINVVSQSTVYDNPYAGYKADGAPPPNPAVTLPIPNDNPTGQVVATATATTTTPSNGANPGTVFILVALVSGIVIVFFVFLFFVRRRKSG